MKTFDYHGWQLTHDHLVLRSDDREDSSLGPTTLLVALDDTGDPTTNDPQHPVFGLGGCAVLVGQYFEVVRTPWVRLKAQRFAGATVPLHAADVRTPSAEQLEALNGFFRRMPLFRFAAVTTRELALNDPAVRVEVMGMAVIASFSGLRSVCHSRRSRLCAIPLSALCLPWGLCSEA